MKLIQPLNHFYQENLYKLLKNQKKVKIGYTMVSRIKDKCRNIKSILEDRI